MKPLVAISHWDKFMSWPTFLDSVMGLLIKASEALTADPRFAYFWDGSKGKTLRGAFHFYRDAYAPVAQAKFFCDTVGETLLSDMPLTVDIEDKLATRKGKQLWPRVKDVLDYVQVRSGRVPQIYTAKWWWDSWMLDGLMKTPPPWAGDYPLHVAYYGPLSALPKMQPKGCQQPWTLWQYGGDEWGEAIPGLVGLGDVSRPHCTGSDLDTLEWLKMKLGVVDGAPPTVSDAEKLARLWEHHPELHSIL